MTLNEWANAALAHQFGNYIDVDGYYQGQCWDLAAHYAREVVGCPSLPTVTGGAEGVYNRFAAPIPDYFTRVKNNPADANQLPPAGSLIVYGPTSGNPYGHIEIVMGANASGVDVILQDGFNPTQGPIRKFRKWGSLPTLGWLVPKKNVTDRPLQGFQRVVASAGVYRRKSPSTNETALELFKGGEVLDFGGWLYGQVVDGNNVWFKGRYSDTYFWSGAFDDKGTHDLADLNPVAPPPVTNPNQRKVVDGGLNVRGGASTMDQIIKVLPEGTVVTVLAYTTKGANVDGNTLWFRIADGWVWSGGLDGRSVDGVTNETPADPTPPTPTDPVTPTPPATPDPLVKQVVNKKHPNSPLNYVPTDLVTVGGGQRMRKEAADALGNMQAAALRDGVTIVCSSGYRSFDTQTTVYNNYVKQDGQAKADTYSARPGYSEHQTGLAMDFGSIDDSFADTPASSWLIANAHKFGFVLRYPKDKQAVTGYVWESWHWRYIGVDEATKMKESGKTTLEEYYGVTGGLYADQDPKPTDPVDPSDPDPTPTDPVEPTPEPEKPKEEKDATVEAAKLLGRQGLLAAISALLTAVGDWVLFQLAGVNLPKEILVSAGGVIYAGLLALDKWIHENAKTKLKGLIPF